MRRQMFVASMALSLLISAGCGDGTRVPITEYDRGYNEGVRAVRESRKEIGELGTGAGMIGVEIQSAVGPLDESESADWNAGARKGMWDEYYR